MFLYNNVLCDFSMKKAQSLPFFGTHKSVEHYQYIQGVFSIDSIYIQGVFIEKTFFVASKWLQFYVLAAPK